MHKPWLSQTRGIYPFELSKQPRQLQQPGQGMLVWLRLDLDSTAWPGDVGAARVRVRFRDSTAWSGDVGVVRVRVRVRFDSLVRGCWCG